MILFLHTTVFQPFWIPSEESFTKEILTCQLVKRSPATENDKDVILIVKIKNTKKADGRGLQIQLSKRITC